MVCTVERSANRLHRRIREWLWRKRQWHRLHHVEFGALSAQPLEVVEHHVRGKTGGPDAEPGEAGTVGDLATERSGEEGAKAATGVDNSSPAVRELDPFKLTERREEVPGEALETLAAIFVRLANLAAVMVDRVVASEQNAVVGRASVVVKLVCTVGDPFTTAPPDALQLN